MGVALIRITARNVTPIFTSRGQVEENNRKYKHIDLSGLSVKGNVRRFFRMIYYPFLRSKNVGIEDVESKIFGSSANTGGASLFAFDVFFDDDRINMSRRPIAKTKGKKDKKPNWRSTLDLLEGRGLG